MIILCMDIALFDLYTTGHHLSYAARIKRALETVSEDEVTFITLSETSQCKDWFDSDEIDYIDAPDAPPLENRDRSFRNIVDEKISEFCSKGMLEQYDVVHFLYADDIFGPLWRHCPRTTETQLIAELNGVFFHRGTVLQRKQIHSTWLRLLQSPVGRLIDHALPNRTDHESLWADVYLYRFLNRGTFDHVVVHSMEAADYLSRLNPRQASTITKIPYPAPTDFGTDISKSAARDRLGLPSDDPLLLFFGGMRTERGIDILLDALRQYDETSFTMFLAGPPTAVSEREIECIDDESVVNIIYEFGFIDTPELYYRASDAVILPYTWQYGQERASQMFEEICGAARPVIVPDFGVLGRLTEEWELGTTYEQESVHSLTSVLAKFARDEISYSTAQMEEYNTKHSYKQTATTLSRIYTSSQQPQENLSADIIQP